MKTSILVVQRINNQIYNDQISVLANLFSCVFSFPHLQLSDMKQKFPIRGLPVDYQIHLKIVFSCFQQSRQILRNTVGFFQLFFKKHLFSFLSCGCTLARACEPETPGQERCQTKPPPQHFMEWLSRVCRIQCRFRTCDFISIQIR